jgi:hypothetical protein
MLVCPSRPPSVRRSLACAAAVGAAVASGACGSATEPGASSSGFYRLMTVDGVRVPFSRPTSAGFVEYDNALLDVRNDGTYRLAIFGPYGALEEGRWSRNREGVTLRALDAQGAAFTRPVVSRRDSLIYLAIGSEYVGADRRPRRDTTRFAFARVTRPTPALDDGVWVLRTVDGRGPDSLGFRLYTTRLPRPLDTQFLSSYLAYDTITVIAPFVRRAERVNDIVTEQDGRPLPDRSWSIVSVASGVLDGDAARPVLTPLRQWAWSRSAADTLVAEASSRVLVRRLRITIGAPLVELRYERLR